eukprot:s2712_g2.t5
MLLATQEKHPRHVMESASAPTDVADESSKDAAAAEPANAAGSDSGSFSRLTHAAEFYASQAATQAAGLFSYKKTGDEKSQESPHGTAGAGSDDVAAQPANAAGSDSGSFSRLTYAAEFYASQAATQAAGLFSYKKTGDEKSQVTPDAGAAVPGNDVAAAETANAAGSDSGSFSRLTHAAEFYASQAATQAAGLFSYKKTGDEKSEEPKVVDWTSSLAPVFRRRLGMSCTTPLELLMPLLPSLRMQLAAMPDPS